MLFIAVYFFESIYLIEISFPNVEKNSVTDPLSPFIGLISARNSSSSSRISFFFFFRHWKDGSKRDWKADESRAGFYSRF